MFTIGNNFRSTLTQQHSVRSQLTLFLSTYSSQRNSIMFVQLRNGDSKPVFSNFSTDVNMNLLVYTSGRPISFTTASLCDYGYSCFKYSHTTLSGNFLNNMHTYPANCQILHEVDSVYILIGYRFIDKSTTIGTGGGEFSCFVSSL